MESNDSEYALISLLEAAQLYERVPLELKNIKVLDMLGVISPDSSMYNRLARNEYRRLATVQTEVKELFKQEAMKQLLLKYEAEEREKANVAYWRLWAVIGGVISILVIVSWRLWWRNWKAMLTRDVKEIYREDLKFDS